MSGSAVIKRLMRVRTNAILVRVLCLDGRHYVVEAALNDTVLDVKVHRPTAREQINVMYQYDHPSRPGLDLLCWQSPRIVGYLLY